MKWKRVIKVLAIIIGLVVFFKLATIAFVEPWLEEKIETSLQEKLQDYDIELDKAHLVFLSWGIELKSIRIRPREEVPVGHELKLDIESIRLKRIDLYAFIFEKEININEIIISKGKLLGELPEVKQKAAPLISSSRIKIGKIIFRQLEFEVRNFSSPQVYSLKGGTINFHKIEFELNDTISFHKIKEFDFKIEAFRTIMPDSLYTLKAGGIVYETHDKKLTVENFIVHANYPDYTFTARKKYQTDCVRAIIKNISLYDFSIEDFIKKKELVSTFLEVGEMNMHVFRDKRKEFNHTVKPMLQDLIYDYKGKLKIDSIGLTKGSVTYKEHAVEASHPGKVFFTRINAKVYNIYNDTIYKTQEKYLEIKGHTYLMGKGKMTIWLKGKLYDPHNAFLLTGSLSTMEASAVNPMLEKNAFIFVTSGKVHSINFTFTADKYKAKGKMIMLYDGLNVAVKNKETDDTTAIKEKVMSLVANKMIRDANPESKEKVREGIIEYERDPEKFLFNYCFKSILTGLKSSLSKPHKNKEGKKERRKEGEK